MSRDLGRGAAAAGHPRPVARSRRHGHAAARARRARRRSGDAEAAATTPRARSPTRSRRALAAPARREQPEASIGHDSRRPPVQRPRDARLLVVDARGRIGTSPRDALRRLAAARRSAWSPTTPRRCRRACRAARAERRRRSRCGWPAGARSAADGRRTDSSRSCSARATSARAPKIGRCRRRSRAGDRLELGPLARDRRALLGHPRLVVVALRRHAPTTIWAGLARARPADPVRARAGAARAVGRVDADRRRRRWRSSRRRPASCSTGRRSSAMQRRGVAFATLTHAAGISSTGDAELDRAAAVRRAVPHSRRRRRPRSATRGGTGGRVVAIGTTVVRALEHAAGGDGVRRSRRGRGEPAARAGERSCASSTRSSPAPTSRARATTSCCARSPTTRR